MEVSRSRAAELGRETVAIVEAGAYRARSGRSVEILEAVEAPVPTERETEVEVVDESTLAAARRLVREGGRAVALNFASAKNPGGGFVSGARAQEESLARSSALVACLDGNPMYEIHRAGRRAAGSKRGKGRATKRPDPDFHHTPRSPKPQ